MGQTPCHVKDFWSLNSGGSITMVVLCNCYKDGEVT